MKEYVVLTKIDIEEIPNCRLLTSFEREDYYAQIHGYSEQDRLEMNPNAPDEVVHEIMDEEGIPRYIIENKIN